MHTDPHILQRLPDARGVKFSVLRLDLLYPQYGGNKFFKLKYNLAAALEQGAASVLTFGGAFSNHIAATAAAAQEKGLRSIGVIRGEAQEELNPTLKFAQAHGMEFAYMDRETYREKNEVRVQEELRRRFPGAFFIPEGGSNVLGVKGCTEILRDHLGGFDTACVACGTGATLAGLSLSLREDQRVVGFPVLKDGGFLEKEIDRLLQEFASMHHAAPRKNYSLQCDHHFGGYAKTEERLLSFMAAMEEKHQLPLDYVYTGKMFFGVFDLLEKNFFSAGERVLLVHTGGLQGNAGRAYFEKRS